MVTQARAENLILLTADERLPSLWGLRGLARWCVIPLRSTAPAGAERIPLMEQPTACFVPGWIRRVRIGLAAGFPARPELAGLALCRS
jgi:hypothetical protein